MYHERDLCVEEFAWAVPTQEALVALARYAPLVEMGAGNGYWAWLLRQAGVDVIPYDPYPPRHGDNPYWKKQRREWTLVRQGDESALAEHDIRTLFLCWPPYDDPFATRCLQAFRGAHVIYVGEHDGGCCADDTFFRLLDDGFACIESIDLPQWRGIHDYMTVWARRERA
jgi:hypothetical protein